MKNLFRGLIIVGVLAISQVAYAQNPGVTTTGSVTAGDVVIFIDRFHIQKAGTGVGKPCTTTALSLQYNNAGVFGCITGFTSDGTNILATTTALFQFGGTSGSFPALKYDSAGTLAVRTASDGGYGNIKGLNAVWTGTSSVTGGNAVSLPQYWGGSNNTGVSFGSADANVIIGGSRYYYMNSSYFQIVTGNVLGFGTIGSPDTGLSRISAGVVGFGNGTAGNISGGLQAATAALGGATIGSNALAVTGSANISGQLDLGDSSLGLHSTAKIYSPSTGVITLYNYAANSFTTLGLYTDLFLTRSGAASLQLGAVDGSPVVAQTLRVQSVVAGTAAANGANWTLIGSLGTGTGTPGKIIAQVGIAQSSGTAQSTATTALTLAGAVNGQLPSVVIGGSGANATNATDGFLYIPTSAGQPTGTPTTQGTATVAIQYDTTNHQFWIYDGGWKQPKTPAAAAIITWQ